MATLLQSAPASILLSPSPTPSPRTLPLGLPNSPQRFPSSLSSTSSSEEDEGAEKPKSRRIRFAPLPIPDPATDIIYLEPQDPSSHESTDSFVSEVSCGPPPLLPECQTPTIDISTPMTPKGSFSLPPSPTESSPKKPSLSRRLFKPLFSQWNKSSSSITPSSTPATDSFYRTASRESTQSARYPNSATFGSPLARWESSGSVSSYVSESGRSLNRRPQQQQKRSSFNPLSRVQSTPQQTPGPQAKPGMRMLNGRVYGRRRPYAKESANPFANVKDTEPEFVEWGYGGMGSTNTTAASGVGGHWKKVQQSGSTMGDEEDSSGMAWVRKRKEERERAKKEAEEKEKAEKAGPTEEKPSEGSPPAEDASSSRQQQQEEETTPKKSPISLPPSSPIQEETPKSTPHHEEEEHVYNTVTLPPTRHGHGHSRSLSRQATLEKTPTLEIPFNPEEISKPSTRERSDSNGSTSEEESPNSEDGDDEDDSYSDSDSEEDEKALEAARKTALGAGVEKISRHKDHTQQHQVAATERSAPTSPTS